MRKLTNSKFNELPITDRITNETIVYYYRKPTYAEQIKYGNELYQRIGDEIIMTPQTRVDYGALVVTGFKDGSFCGEDNKPLTTNKENAGNTIKVDGEDKELVFCEGWKEMLIECEVGDLALVALDVFESRFIPKKTDYENIKVKINAESGDEPNFSEEK